MIDEHFLCHFSQLPAAPHLQQFEVGEKKILLVHSTAGLFATAAECPHAKAPLAEGALCGHRLVCPWHQGTFDVRTGALLEPVPLDPLPTYPLRVEADRILVALQERPAPEKAGANGAEKHVAIVGSGTAGIAAAVELRACGFAGKISLLDPEPAAPYDRTQLSKMFLSGQASEAQLPLRHPDQLAKLQLQRIQQRVEILDALARRIELSDGTVLSYDDAIICTGGVPKRPDLPGLDLPGVHFLRSLEDVRKMQPELARKPRVVIIGASFIALEAASALRERQLEVTVVAPVEVPFARQLGPRLGTAIQHWLEKNGVQFSQGSEVAALEGAPDAVGGVLLKSGDTLPADFVLIGLGVTPATDFLRNVPLADDGSVPVDENLQAAPHLFVAGDIARFPLKNGELTRIEHFRVAMQHGRRAAQKISGQPASTDSLVPFFWTYFFGRRYNFVGHADAWDEILCEGDPKDGAFLAWFIQAGQVVAAFGYDRETDLAHLHELFRTGDLPSIESLRGRRDSRVLV